VELGQWRERDVQPERDEWQKIGEEGNGGANGKVQEGGRDGHERMGGCVTGRCRFGGVLGSGGVPQEIRGGARVVAGEEA